MANTIMMQNARREARRAINKNRKVPAWAVALLGGEVSQLRYEAQLARTQTSRKVRGIARTKLARHRSGGAY